MTLEQHRDTIVVTQPAPALAGVIIVMFAIASFAAAYALMWTFPGVVLALLLAGGGIFIIGFGALSITDTVATFDATAQTMTIDRSGLCRHTCDRFGFADILQIATREHTHVNPRNYSLRFTYKLEITLAGERSVTICANGREECDDAVRRLTQLIWKTTHANVSDAAEHAVLQASADAALLVTDAMRWLVSR
jgi:hypothetical protein